MNVDKSGTRIRQMFAEISGRYDRLNHLLSGGTDYYWRWRAVRAAGPIGDAPILDVCTGTGDLAFAFWKRSRGRVRVIGTDFTHDMLKLALLKRQSLGACGDGRRPIDFLEADTQRLPFPDDRFEIVSVAFGLRNVSDAEQALREMVRVCRSGGRVVILEFSIPTNRLVRPVYLFYFRHVLPRIGQWLARNRALAYNYLPQSVCEFSRGETPADLMRRSGLASVTARPLSLGVATLYCGTKPV